MKGTVVYDLTCREKSQKGRAKMFRILLVEPPCNMGRLQRIKSRLPHMGAPLPFVYIATYLLKAGFMVDIIDMRISSEGELAKYLKEKKPLLAGISVMPGHALPRTIRLNSFIKRHSPSTRIVWGGPFPSLHYELCLSIPNVDYVVCGDGEITLTELATALQNSADLSSLDQIDGLSFRDNGTITSTKAREAVDINNQPVGAWHLVERYMPYYLGPRRYLAISTARGCPFKCSFCYNNLLYKGFKRYRVKSVDNVMAEIEYLSEKYKINKLQFMDDDFLGHRKRGLELMASIKRKYPRMKFHIAARVDELNKEETVRQLAESGCESVFLGVESASTEQLSMIQKGCTTNETIKAAMLCSKYNIIPTHSFTCGYPGETRADLFADVSMAKALKNIDDRSQSIIEIISPIAGTPLFEDLRKRDKIPGMTSAKWCLMTDWKSAKQKPWIRGPGFYEAFQLAFFLAFTSRGHSLALRFITQFLSRWSRYRLIGKKPGFLPEFRLMNFFIKKALWGWMQ
jgi:radical SAM superfamily enzyme YgiQ (UPF0313 family)